jgi:hypothetical protein
VRPVNLPVEFFWQIRSIYARAWITQVSMRGNAVRRQRSIFDLCALAADESPRWAIQCNKDRDLFRQLSSLPARSASDFV